MSKPIQMLYLPDTLANWQWPRQMNPHYEEINAESNAWFHSFKAFTEHSQRAFDRGEFGRLAALAYPRHGKEHLRTACDLMNVYFMIEEYTDVESAPVVRQMADVVMDALNNPYKPRPKDETLLGEVTRQFWALAIKTSTPNAQKHFIETFADYTDSLVDQAAGRDSQTICNIDSYLKTRRDNIGARPAYVIGVLHSELPDEVYYHPLVRELGSHCADLIFLDNDIVSYNKEQATGDDRYNILTIVMHQFNIDLDGAIAWVVKLHEEVQARFLEGLKRLPSFGSKIDDQLEEYIFHVANWPRANNAWNFENGRYLGSKVQEIRESRCVPLLPKVKREQVVARLPLGYSKQLQVLLDS